MGNSLKMWSHVKLFGFFLLFACGCARIPKHEMATTFESADCDQAVLEALNTGSFTLGDWPSCSWWEDFDDPILTDLIESALKLSPTLQRAEEQLKAAKQFSLQKKARLFPEIDLEADNEWEHLARDGFFRAFAPSIPAVVDDTTLGLSFNYEFDFWGKNRKLFHAALGQASALLAEKMQAELILTTSIAYTYAELQFFLRKEQILKQLESHKQSITDIRIKRQKNALDTSIKRLRSQSNTLDIQASLLEIEEEIQKNLHKLKALSGVGQDYVLDIEQVPLKPLQVALPESLSLDLIARRPDLVAQKARIEAACKEVGAAKTDFYPNVNLMAFVGLESVFWSQLFKRKNYDGSLEPAIHLPIFTAGRLRAQLMEKVANFNEAVFTYNEMILQTAQEVADRLTTISLLEKQINVRLLSLQTAEDEEELTEQRFNNAIEDLVALLDAKNSVLEMELTLSELEYGKQLVAIQLIRALGGGYHE